MRVAVSAVLVSIVCAGFSGCRKTAADVTAAKLERAAQVERARKDLQQIPPPSKTLYASVQNLENWQNPSITVQEKMMTVHVLEPDANPSDLGKGTMLRPEAARQQVLNIDINDLAQALNAVPREAWPYGRVVAIEEARDAPAAARPQLRRNIEHALDTLTSVGIVAEEYFDNRPVGNR